MTRFRLGGASSVQVTAIKILTGSSDTVTLIKLISHFPSLVDLEEPVSVR